MPKAREMSWRRTNVSALLATVLLLSASMVIVGHLTTVHGDVLMPRSGSSLVLVANQARQFETPSALRLVPEIHLVNGASPFDTMATSQESPANYSVTFSESGLPEGTVFTVFLAESVHELGNTSTSPIVGFSVPNGTYGYSVYTPVPFRAIPDSGSVTVDGSNVYVPLRFAFEATLSFYWTGPIQPQEWLLNVTNESLGFSWWARGNTHGGIPVTVIANASYSYSMTFPVEGTVNLSEWNTWGNVSVGIGGAAVSIWVGPHPASPGPPAWEWGVGIGVPIALAAIVSVLFLRRRRKPAPPHSAT